MINLDSTLVSELQRDGRASIQQLAHAAGAPRGTVSTRLRRLLAEKRLRIVASADPTLLGQHVIAHVAITVSGTARETIAALVVRPEMVFVSAVSGQHSVVAEVRVGTTADLHDLLGELRTDRDIVAIDTLLYTEVVKGHFVVRAQAAITIDEIDRRLIGLLQDDARASYRDLAGAVRLSASATANRVKRLLEHNVVTISAIEAGTPGCRQLTMGVGLNLAGPGNDAQEAAKAMAAVDFAATTVGRFDLVATLTGRTSHDLLSELDRIRALPDVSRIVTWLHLDVVKEDYTRRHRAFASPATPRPDQSL